MVPKKESESISLENNKAIFDTGTYLLYAPYN